MTPSRPTPRDWLITLAHLAPAIAWAAVIFVFSSRSNPSVGDVGPGDGKWGPPSELLHFAEFAILAALLLTGVWLLARHRLNDRMSRAREQSILLLVAILSIAYAASDELHQTTVEGRVGSTSDFLVDSLGVMTVILIGGVTLRFLRRRSVA